MEVKSYGGNDDDTFHIGQENVNTKTYGGDGDDTWVRTQDYGEVYNGVTQNTGVEYGRGGAGNDVVKGTHYNEDNQWLWGGDGEDKLYGGDYVAGYGYISGGDGDDWIQGGDNTDVSQYLYGDSTDFDDNYDSFGDNQDEANYGEDNNRYSFTDRGDDVIYGGDNVNYGYGFGGYGDDKIIGGHGEAYMRQTFWGDHGYGAFPEGSEEYGIVYGTPYGQHKYKGLPGDGDDLIDIGDSVDGYGYAFGQGGNDKIMGGLRTGGGYMNLFGGDGDDKLWTVNPGQFIDPVNTPQ